MTISENIDIIKRRMEDARKKSPFSQETALLLATKGQSAETVNRAISCGVTQIGENRVQELLEKYDAIDREKVRLHFIGHLQTNKVKYIIDKVDMIQSLDRLPLARQIDREAEKHGKIMDVLVQVNLAMEESKSGVAPEELEDFLRRLSDYSSIRVRGLMAIPPIMENKGTQRKYFQKIMQKFVDISSKKIDNIHMQILSIGMSGDYELAIEEGSTMIRIGTAVFGERMK